jgi:hypothetical protein
MYSQLAFISGKYLFHQQSQVAQYMVVRDPIKLGPLFGNNLRKVMKRIGHVSNVRTKPYISASKLLFIAVFQDTHRIIKAIMTTSQLLIQFTETALPNNDVNEATTLKCERWKGCHILVIKDLFHAVSLFPYP